MREFFSFEEICITPSLGLITVTFLRNAFIFSLGGLALNAWSVAITSSICIFVPSDQTHSFFMVQLISERFEMSQFAISHS